MIDSLSSEEWEVLKPLTELVELKKGDFLFHEGEEAEELFFIAEGELSVIKEGHLIAILKKGAWVGEIAPLTKKMRTASIKAKENCRLFKISFPALQKATQTNPQIYYRIIADLSKVTAEKLAESSNEIVRSTKHKLKLAQERNEMGQFFVYFLIAFSTFFYIQKAARVTEVMFNISVILILFLAVMAAFFVKKSRLPIQAYGLTLKQSKPALIKASIGTPLIILITLATKWAIIHFIPAYHSTPLFIVQEKLKMDLSPLDWALITLGYALFVPAQEFVARGCLQGALMKFLRGRRKNLLSILLSNLVFSALHLQISLEVALFAFSIGCFWGWLYAQHQTIVGVSVSHIILGVWGFVILGPVGIG